eukprot:c7881_g1_i2.p1 GENE.c7881_g1_i2~~c7881_g1_i2.p1  ORF type:complete len:108 (-),score=24.65 c7881_g1_i2:59-382(-)
MPAFKSLCVVLAALRGEQVIIDLLNETSIRGCIIDADTSMNVTLADCEIQNTHGVHTQASQLHVCGRHIRHVQLPDNVGVPAKLKELEDRMEKGRKAYTVVVRKTKQ